MTAAIVLVSASAITSGAAQAGETFHTAMISQSLISELPSAIPFQGSAVSAAPLLQTATGEWYNRLGNSAVKPERVAALETGPKVEAGLATASSEKPVAEAMSAVAVAEPAATIQPTTSKTAQASMMLAFADSSPKAEGGALAAIRSISPAEETIEGGIDLGALEVENVPVPIARPDREEVIEQPAAKAVEQVPAKAVASLPPSAPVAPAEKGQSGGFLKKLFGGSSSRTGNNRIAVYDISAAKVYMPDGSVLEAHSGIGKMADNPRYVHVKMNGPTPPQTYNLRMRETRFHGVEAVRMTPVGSQTMHGRDGMLTHSYLLRNRPGQSHGCVAFKEYHKFLAAFKRGHVKQILVVPGGGAGTFARANSKRGDDA